MSDSYVTTLMRDALSGHVLVERLNSDPAGLCHERDVIRVFRLGKPGTRMMSVDIIFAAGRIWISGDLCIADRGVVSDLGYGIAWFSRGNSEDYLAEKFLRKRHVPALAVAEVKDDATRFLEERFVDGEEPTEEARQQKTALEEAASQGESGPCGSAHEVWELYSDLEIDTSDGVPGWGYDPKEVGWLAAVQQRFAELYSSTMVWIGAPA